MKFLLLKVYPNDEYCRVVAVGTAQTGEELDRLVEDTGECQWGSSDIDYWETRVIDLETLDVLGET